MRPRDFITLFGAWLWPLVAYRQSDRMQWLRVLRGLDGTISSRCSAVHEIEPRLKGGPPRDPGRSKDTHIVDLEKRVEVLSRELGEALEQQAATSEVLRVISNSPGELKPVFQTMLANATRICEANFGVLFRFEGGIVAGAAMLQRSRQHLPSSGNADLIGRVRKRPSVALYRRGRRFILPMLR